MTVLLFSTWDPIDLLSSVDGSLQDYNPCVCRAAALPPTSMARSDVIHELWQGFNHLLVFWSLKQLWFGSVWLHSKIEQGSEAGQNNSGFSLTWNPGDKITDKPLFPQASSPAANLCWRESCGIGKGPLKEALVGLGFWVAIPAFLQT